MGRLDETHNIVRFVKPPQSGTGPRSHANAALAGHGEDNMNDTLAQKIPRVALL